MQAEGATSIARDAAHCSKHREKCERPCERRLACRGWLQASQKMQTYVDILEYKAHAIHKIDNGLCPLEAEDVADGVIGLPTFRRKVSGVSFDGESFDDLCERLSVG